MAPGRAPKTQSTFAGLAYFARAKSGGTCALTLSDSAWADIIQNGESVPSDDFTGASGCPGVRKSVKFTLAADPFIVQISGAAKNKIALTLTRAP